MDPIKSLHGKLISARLHAAIHNTAENKRAVAKAEAALKAAHAAAKKTEAVSAPEEVVSYSGADAVAALEFRQWRNSAKIKVWFWEDAQYPACYADKYFATKDAAKAEPETYGNPVLRSTRVPANCATIEEIVLRGELDLHEVFQCLGK